MEMRRVSYSYRYIQEVVYIVTTFPNVRLWSMKARPIPSPAR